MCWLMIDVTQSLTETFLGTVVTVFPIKLSVGL